MTVKQSDANNKSANAEHIEFRLLLNELLQISIKIVSVTTKASALLHALFATKFPKLKH